MAEYEGLSSDPTCFVCQRGCSGRAGVWGNVAVAVVGSVLLISSAITLSLQLGAGVV